MDVSDAAVGKVGLVSTLAVFSVVAFWILTYPFVDADLLIYNYVPDPKWFLTFCALWGLCLVGGLMSFTLYHIYPYL